jgi:hypothetical protein
MKIETGKWYKISNTINLSNYFKAHSYFEGEVSFFECITHGRYCKHSILKTWNIINAVCVEDIDNKHKKYLPDDHPEKLINFPSVGFCLSLDENLIKYLRDRTSEDRILLHGMKGVAWNESGYWFVKSSSTKKEYKLYQLEPFINCNIKEWSIGTYAVVTSIGFFGYSQSLTHIKKTRIGDIYIISNTFDHGVIGVETEDFVLEKQLVKWFPTKSEAEYFVENNYKLRDKLKFNIGDWVVFEVNKCTGKYDYCKTKAWDRDMILQVKKINNSSLMFDSAQMSQLYPHYNWGLTQIEVGNNMEVFRLAHSWEIPTKTDPCDEIVIANTEGKKDLLIFVENTQKSALTFEEPIKINILKTKLMKINLVK